MSSETDVLLRPDETRELVTEFARAVVVDLARDEGPAYGEEMVFDRTAAEFFEDPEAVLHPRTDREDPLGIGGGVDEFLFTPYALAVMTSVIQFLVGVVVEAVQSEARPRLVTLVRRLFDPAARAAGEPQVTLTAKQIQAVREKVYDNALALPIDEPHAGLLADAVAGRLATGS